MKSCVYVIRALTTNRYKIGYARDIDVRLSVLRRISPLGLRVVATHYCGACQDLERSLHTHFADRRLHGEWFELTLDDISFLRMGTSDLMKSMGVIEESWAPWVEDPVVEQPDEIEEIANSIKITTTNNRVFSLENLKESLLKRNEGGESWAGMGRKYDVNPAVLWRIVKENYNPKKAELRAKLGLPELITMEIHHNDEGYKMEQTV